LYFPLTRLGIPSVAMATSAAASTQAAAAAATATAAASSPQAAAATTSITTALLTRLREIASSSPAWVRWLFGTLGVGGVVWLLWRFIQRRRRAAQIRSVINQLHLLRIPLKHNYYMVRHGESTANVEGIISSDPSISTVTHGLTARGVEQVTDQASQWSARFPPNQPILLISSDFTRARETAQELHRRLRVRAPIAIETRLRERSFGEFNGQHTDNYQRVWNEDAKSADHTTYGVESVHAVVKRATSLILDLEEGRCPWDSILLQAASAASGQTPAPTTTSNHNLIQTALAALPFKTAAGLLSESSSIPSCTILFVSHGDVCQILASAFEDMDPRNHRSLTHWKNGEIRQLVWKPKGRQTEGEKAFNAQAGQMV